jgi:hypothetical protein
MSDYAKTVGKLIEEGWPAKQMFESEEAKQFLVRHIQGKQNPIFIPGSAHHRAFPSSER